MYQCVSLSEVGGGRVCVCGGGVCMYACVCVGGGVLNFNILELI